MARVYALEIVLQVLAARFEGLLAKLFRMASRKSAPKTEPTTKTPLWETLAMVGSFVLLWAWFLAHQSALKANVPLALAWNIALGISLLVMIWITVRRMRRFKRALDETAKNSRRGVPGMPWMQIPDDKRKK